MRRTVAILGIPFDDLDTAQVLERLDEFVRSRRFHQVATANTDFVVRAQTDPELRAALLSADLVVPDGMPIVLASRWLGAGLRERVTGSDLVPQLARRAAGKGYGLYMLGARPDVAQRARERLEADCPGLRVVGCVSPPVAPVVCMDHETLLRQIEGADPDILLVAFGNPKQEKWIHMHRHRLKVPVCIGVGGTFDFLAGETARAPEYMQRAGLEWLHRLTHEPRRLWRRYSTDFVHFARLMTLQLWTTRRGADGVEGRVVDAPAGECTVVSVDGPLSGERLAELQFVTDGALSAGGHVVVDLQAATAIDVSCLGPLLNLPKRAAHVGREIRLVAQPGRVMQALRLAGADEHCRVYPTVGDAMRGGQSAAPDIAVEADDSWAVVAVRGRADVEAARALCRRLGELSTQSVVDVDLRAASYVDSALLAAIRAFALGGGDGSTRHVRLVAGGPAARVLERDGLRGHFELVDAPRAPVTGEARASAASSRVGV